MKQAIVFFAIVAVGIFGISSCQQSDWYKEDRAKKAEAERREATPHVIREADGCKVYAFKSGERYHYFTRCPDSRTTTSSNWEECQGTGKMRTCKQASESIEAER